MRLLGAMPVVLCASVPAWARSPLAAEVRALELGAGLGEKAPACLADWTLEDAPRALLASREGRS